MTVQSSLAVALERTAPPMGGFSLTVLRLEVRRLLRNRRTMALAIAMPVLFFFSFGRSSAYVHQIVGRGNLTAFSMISIALFGGVFATATGGAMVSIERTLGWSRQLRVTPLSPAAYIAIKMLTSLTLAAGAVGAVYLVGLVTSQASMPSDLWAIAGVLRVDRVALIFCVWTIYWLSASLRKCHASTLARLDAVQLRRRPPHSDHSVSTHLCNLGEVDPAVWTQ